ncbi:DrmB family protein [Olsenella uli]|uniref:DrmB family protein n=1 Tax=Olsenella uli TaxID=133926 RepID=UPI003D7ACC61
MARSDFEQTVRKSQVISPWGIGAIVPFPKNRSMMIAGLDMWDYGGDEDSYLIDDERLAKYIGVKQLREPPVETREGARTGLSLPAVLFPLWHYCPRCGRMKLLKSGSDDQFCTGTAAKPHSEERMIPERFVAICPHGHIQDFPIMEWVHGGEDPDDAIQHEITRSTVGSSTTLAAVKYKCSCGASRNMMGATRDGALADVGVYCQGNRPWLGKNHEDCNQQLKVVQAGGSNVWFPIVKSSIWIPPMGGDAYLQHGIERYRVILESAIDAEGQLDSGAAEAVAKSLSIDVATLKKEWALYKAKIDGVDNDESMTEEDYRSDEYRALCSERGSDKSSFSCRKMPIGDYGQDFDRYFTGITLVRKLQETRAFVGFSRVEPNVSASCRETLGQLSVSGLSWAPAIKVFGEGIFFQFNASRMRDWSSNKIVMERALKLTQSYNKAALRWGRPEISVRPEYVLIHTFAHLIINRLSFDCGYGSSSIRERIYCDLSSTTDKPHDMLGLLIYTASGDSEGSLGGLVRMGEPGHLEGVVWRALEDAMWCSSDPVCSQSEGQGPDSCNLAACHNCALLPETCCENGNRLLDRLMVVSGFGVASGYFDVD